MGQVHAWLRMAGTAGDFPIADSEQAYNDNIDLIDVVQPSNGGLLQDDGSWLRDSDLVDNAFAQALPGLAQGAGQEYMPGVNPGGHDGDFTDLYTVLDNEALWSTAADNLVAEATTDGFDAPWDGMFYDVIGVLPAYVTKQESFMTTLSTAVRAAGLPFGVACVGIASGYDAGLPSLDVIAQIADRFDHYMYGWWEDPKSVGPYWWAESAIQNALVHNVPPQNTCLGIANYSRYWPVRGGAETHDVTHDQAMQLVTANGASVQWIENDGIGCVRESYAVVGAGNIWISDASTVSHRLDLADSFGLSGMMIFSPSMGNEPIWRAIAEWKKLPELTTPYLYQTGGIFGGRP